MQPQQGVSEKEEYKLDPNIVWSPCHSRPASSVGVFLIDASGDQQQIGITLYCSANWIGEKGKSSIYCFKPFGEPKRFKAWPEDLNSVWEKVELKLSYWTCAGFHFVRDDEERWVSFNTVQSIPPFKNIKNLTPMALRILKFRARADPTFPPSMKEMFLKEDEPKPEQPKIFIPHQQPVKAMVNAVIREAKPKLRFVPKKKR